MRRPNVLDAPRRPHDLDRHRLGRGLHIANVRHQTVGAHLRECRQPQEAKGYGLVRKYPRPHRQTRSSQRYDRPDPATVIKVRSIAEVCY